MKLLGTTETHEEGGGTAATLTTGIPRLDEMLTNTPLNESVVMAYSCLSLYRQNSKIGEGIYAILESQIAPEEFKKTLDGPEKELIIEWLSFLDGYLAGSKGGKTLIL